MTHFQTTIRGPWPYPIIPYTPPPPRLSRSKIPGKPRRPSPSITEPPILDLSSIAVVEDMRRSKLCYEAIAAIFNVSRATIYRACHRKSTYSKIPRQLPPLTP